jgi:AraC-like DNA-binding protein
MDKATAYMDNSLDGSMALRRAVETLLDALSGQPAAFADALSASQARRHRSGSALRPRFELHTHPHAEMTCCVQGQARLFLQDRSVAMASAWPVVIPPEVVHAEGSYGCGRADRPYVLLWCTFLPAAVTFFLSAYRPVESGVAAGRFFMLRTATASELATVTLMPKLASDRHVRARFQSLMLHACLESLEQMDKAPREEMSYHQAMVAQIVEYLRTHYDRPITVDALARIAHCTPNYLNTLFRESVGVPIHRFLLDHRLMLAKGWLSDRQMSVKRVAYQAGFSDPLYFSRLFRKRFGLSPAQFKNACEG